MTVATVKHESTGRTVKLGRKRPESTTAVGRFRYVKTDDGKTIVMPRLGSVYKEGKDEAPPPDKIDWSDKAGASLDRMYKNDQLGCCVISSKFHALGTWTGNDATEVLATDQEVVSAYHTICGPGDNGCNIAEVLDYWKQRGMTAGGKKYKIDGFVSVDNSNQLLVKVAIQVFGGVTIGVNLTQDCTDSGPGVVWNFAGRIVGGHDVRIYGYNNEGVLVSTWGTIGTLIPWKVFQRRVTSQPGVEECYVELSPDWYGNDKLAPNGIDADALAKDLEAIDQGNVPDVPTPTPPGPAPVPPGPTPGPVPPPPMPPVPPLSWWQLLIAWLESLIHGHTTMGQPIRSMDFGTGANFGLTKDATLEDINWQGLIAWIKAELALYGPAVVPVIQAWINTLPVPAMVKTVLMLLLSMLVNQLPPAPPTLPALVALTEE